jgi:hypothetical protein
LTLAAPCGYEGDPVEGAQSEEGQVMNRMHRLAKLLVCSWVLGGEEPQDLPTSHGILDRALQIANDQRVLPGWFWEQVHFADSRVGLQCVELPDILDWAQTAELTEVPNPTYRRTRVKVSPAVAKRMLDDLAISVEDAAAWGKSLRMAANQALSEFAAAS